MPKIQIQKKLTNEGPQITITLPWSLLKAIEIPKNCEQCPVGYMDQGCGRNVPFQDSDRKKRPDTCKLSQLTAEDIAKIIKEGDCHD